VCVCVCVSIYNLRASEKLSPSLDLPRSLSVTSSFGDQKSFSISTDAVVLVPQKTPSSVASRLY
jgi:hypothetical protein